jgi:hypothetical protein
VDWQAISGDLKGLEALVERVDGDKLTVMPQHKDLHVRTPPRLCLSLC